MPDPLRPLPPDLGAEPDADALARVWDLLGDAPAPPADLAETEADWARVQAALAPASPARAADREPVRAARRPAVRWGAALAAVVVLGLALVWGLRPVTVGAPAGETRTAALPDGSTVELNAGSRLTYARGFRGLALAETTERRVRLDGEAFFAVAPGERPFVVETHDAAVTVLGTRFNVRGRAGAATAVTVEEGRVRVAPRAAPDAAAVLGAGEAARVAADRAEPSAAGHALAWRTGGFAVQGEPLWFVLEELERRYGAEIRLANGAAARDTLTLYFPQPPDLPSILRDLATARDLRFRRTRAGYELY